MPLELLQAIGSRLAPQATNKMKRTFSQAPDTTSEVASEEFTTFPLKVGRNSFFLDLTTEQKEELGGIEYRASRLLLKIVYGVSERIRSGE
jgi:hypothetical protein